VAAVLFLSQTVRHFNAGTGMGQLKWQIFVEKKRAVRYGKLWGEFPKSASQM
jgi:hypothetical protein